MTSYTRRDFEIDFERLNFDDKELAIYTALKLSRLRPQDVGNSYQFLTSDDLPDSEKRKILSPVYDIAGSTSDFLRYVFRQSPEPADDVARLIVRMINRDSYDLIRKARKNGLDVSGELEFVRSRRKNLLNKRPRINDEDLPLYLAFLSSKAGTTH